MNSGISTRDTFQPWQFFVFMSLMAATVGVFLSRGASKADLVFASAAVLATALAGIAAYRMLLPLVSTSLPDEHETLAGRTRAALEREKTLALRSIKELEFDRAMGKLSEADFQEMAARLRVRAARLLKLLDGDETGYRAIIERDVASRLGSGAAHAAQGQGLKGAEGAPAAPPLCARCGTVNDADARFCKSCGTKLA